VIRNEKDFLACEDEIYRGDRCPECRAEWGEIEPHLLQHRDDCAFIAYLNEHSR
jgi:hypothetical protein